MDEKQRFSYWFFFVADAISMMAAYLIAYYIRFFSQLFPVRQLRFYPLAEYTKLLLFLVPVYLLIYDRLRINLPSIRKYIFQEILRIILSNVLCIFCFTVMLYIWKEYNISRIFLLIFLIINVVFGITIRMLYSRFSMRKQ